MKDFVDLAVAIGIVFIFVSLITAAVGIGLIAVPLMIIVFMVGIVYATIKNSQK